jgi:transcriptional regulator with XRE-family HTH domain
MTLGERITYYRNAAGLTQKALAEKMEIGTTRLNYWEKDKREPDVKMINRLARALNISPIALISEEENETPPTSAEPKQEERLTKHEVEGVLIALGLIEDGQHISDRDLDVVSYVISILDAWFEEKRQRR